MDDFFSDSRQDLLNGLNQDPFFGGSEKGDNHSTNGKSIFDFDDNDNFLSNQGRGASQSFNENKSKDYTFEGIAGAIIDVVATFVTCIFIPVKVLPNIIKNTSVGEAIDKLIKSSFMLIPVSAAGLLVAIYGYISGTTLLYAGAIFIFGSLTCYGIFGILYFTLKLSVYGEMTLSKLKEVAQKETIASTPEPTPEEIQEVQEVSSAYDQSFDDIMNEILGAPEENSTNDDFNFSWDDESDTEPSFDSTSAAVEVKEPEAVEGMTLNSNTLWKLFSPLFPPVNPKFDKTVEWASDNNYSEKWKNLYAIIANIFADIYGIDVNEVAGKNIYLTKVKDSVLYTYLEISKPKGRQITAQKLEEYFNNYTTSLTETICEKKYLFDNKDFNKISAKAWLDGNRFCVILTKPNKNPVMLGDLFLKEEVADRISEGKDTPIIIGIDDLGKPIFANFTDKSSPMYAGLVGGVAGSGKSWAFFSLITQICAFSSPEKIQIITVDPKPDTAFNKIALLPHNAKLIQVDLNNPYKLAEDTLDLLEKLTTTEVARRGAKFKEAGCADLPSYMKMGNKDLPYIFVFIDEFIKLRDQMESYSQYKYELEIEEWQDACANTEKGQPKPPKPERIDYVKKLTSLIQVLTTTGRAPGIFLYIISHRFINVVDNQTRLLSPLKIMIKSNDLVEQTLPNEAKTFTKKLLNSGDAAIKVGAIDVKSGKTLGVALDDSVTYNILESIARTYYKIGVDLPDMSDLGPDFVKDLKAIQKQLYKNSNTAQFDRDTDLDDDKDNSSDDVIETFDTPETVENSDNQGDNSLDDFLIENSEEDTEQKESEVNTQETDPQQNDFIIDDEDNEEPKDKEESSDEFSDDPLDSLFDTEENNDNSNRDEEYDFVFEEDEKPNQTSSIEFEEEPLDPLNLDDI